MSLTWVLETNVFEAGHTPLARAAEQLGQEVVLWDDAWWSTSAAPELAGRRVVFQGSLGNADRIRRELAWSPGSYCDSAAFHCSAWYEGAARWLLHTTWACTPADEFVRDCAGVVACLGAGDHVFVRPDSPLKPFSGRVLPTAGLSLEALDHGYYYDDPALPIVVAPVRAVAREWRYVVVERRVVAGCAYEAATRTAAADDPSGEPWRFAAQVAAELAPPEPVYVLDVCEADGSLHLLELNPFSGADLYACDRAAVAGAIGAL